MKNEEIAKSQPAATPAEPINKDLPDELGPFEDEGVPPDEPHHGFRRDDVSPKTRFRWWSTPWRGQFDLFDRPQLLKHIEEAKLPVFDYDERCWE